MRWVLIIHLFSGGFDHGDDVRREEHLTAHACELSRQDLTLARGWVRRAYCEEKARAPAEAVRPRVWFWAVAEVRP